MRVHKNENCPFNKEKYIAKTKVPLLCSSNLQQFVINGVLNVSHRSMSLSFLLDYKLTGNLISPSLVTSFSILDKLSKLISFNTLDSHPISDSLVSLIMQPLVEELPL